MDEKKIINNARLLHILNYPKDPRECVRESVKELADTNDLKDVYNIFDITLDDYCENLSRKVRK